METTESWLGQQWRRFGRGIIIGIITGFVGYLGMRSIDRLAESDRQQERDKKIARAHEEAELKQLGQGVCRDLSVVDDPDQPRRMFACPHPYHMLHSESWGYVCLCIKQPR
jgi:hypothetical protein